MNPPVLNEVLFCCHTNVLLKQLPYSSLSLVWELITVFSKIKNNSAGFIFLASGLPLCLLFFQFSIFQFMKYLSTEAYCCQIRKWPTNISASHYNRILNYHVVSQYWNVTLWHVKFLTGCIYGAIRAFQICLQGAPNRHSSSVSAHSLRKVETV